jgi:prophage regulatory protein
MDCRNHAVGPAAGLDDTRLETMTSQSDETKTNIIRLAQVRARTGLSRSTLYAYMRDGRFPTPITISERCVGWVEAEIDQWIAGRIAASRRT